jgi:cytoskeletal protein RodZ
VAIKPPAAAAEASKAHASAAPASSVSPHKETAKISLPTVAKSVPQATMNLKKPALAAVAPGEKNSAPAEAAATNVAEGKSGNSDLILGIASMVVALLSLGIQVWTMLS